MRLSSYIHQIAIAIMIHPQHRVGKKSHFKKTSASSRASLLTVRVRWFRVVTRRFGMIAVLMIMIVTIILGVRSTEKITDQ
jgi:hypothetical protein